MSKRGTQVSGRPKKAENRLWRHAETAQSSAVQALLKKAAAEGHTPASLAAVLGWDYSQLVQTVKTCRPRLETLVKIATVLRISDATAVCRALLGETVDRDVEEVRYGASGRSMRYFIIGEAQRRQVFRDPVVAGVALNAALLTLPKHIVRRAVGEYLIAKAGLSDEPFDAALGQNLGALERCLAPDFSFKPFFAEAELLRERRREGISWFLLMRKALGLSDEDVAAVGRIIAPYVGEFERSEADHKTDDDARKAALEAYRGACRGDLTAEDVAELRKQSQRSTPSKKGRTL